MAKRGENVRVNVVLPSQLAAEFRETYEAERMTVSEAVRAAVRDWIRARRPVVIMRQA